MELVLERINKIGIEIDKRAAHQLITLTLITLFGLVLRFYKLGKWSFWGDEFITIRNARVLSEANLFKHTISLMGTSAILNAWGVNEWNARFVAAVAGILTILTLYFLVRKMFSPTTALFASGLLAIAPWHIYWSQNARFYTMLLLFSTLALWLFYFALEEDRLDYLLLSLVFMGLALQERLIAAFLVPILMGYVVLLKLLPFAEPPGLRWRNMIVFWAPGLLGGIFLALSNPSVRDPSKWLNSFGFVNNSPFWILGGVTFYVGIPLVCMSAVGAIYLLVRKNRAGLLLSLTAVLPLLAIMVISLVQYTANRYVFISLTAIVTLGGVAARELLARVPKDTKILAVGALLILVAAPMGENLSYYRYQNGNRDNWKDAFAYIAAHKEADDLVVTTHRELANHYLGERTVGMQGTTVDQVIERGKPVWFVIDLTTQNEAPQFYKWIQKNAQQWAAMDVTVSARTFPMRVYFYNPELTPAQPQ